MNTRWAILLFSCALLAGEGAAASDKANIVRDLAGRVGPILGSALACQDIARPRIQLIVDKFTAVIAEASTNEAERSDLTQLLDRNVANGRGAVTSGQTDCRQADRQLADLERSIATPALPAVIAPPDRTTCACRRAVSRIVFLRRHCRHGANRTGPRRSRGPRCNRSRNPVRNRGTVFRLFKRAWAPDEAWDRYCFQPGQ